MIILTALGRALQSKEGNNKDASLAQVHHIVLDDFRRCSGSVDYNPYSALVGPNTACNLSLSPQQISSDGKGLWQERREIERRCHSLSLQPIVYFCALLQSYGQWYGYAIVLEQSEAMQSTLLSLTLHTTNCHLAWRGFRSKCLISIRILGYCISVSALTKKMDPHVQSQQVYLLLLSAL